MSHGEIPGRSKDRRPLTKWGLDHEHPDLLSVVDPPTVLKVALDLNVFLDREATHERDGAEESQALAGDWLAEQVELVVTAELSPEIERLPDGPEKRRQWSAVSRYRRLRAEGVAVDEVAERITAHVLRTQGLDLSADEGDRSDVRYVAEPAEVCGVDVLHPSDVVVRVDELTRAQAYRPAVLHDTEYRLVPVRAGDEERLLAFLYTEGGEERRGYLARIRRLAGQAPHWERHLLYDPRDKAIAFYAAGAQGSELTVPFLRIRPHKLDDTVARQLLFLIRRRARETKLSVVRVTDTHLSPVVVHALRDDGFLHREDGWLGFVIDTCADAAVLDASITVVAQCLDLRLATLRPRLSPIVAAGVERTFWPAKLVYSELPTFLIPIKPAWSADLFGVPQTIQGRSNLLGLSREHVYYRSPIPRGETAPARLLWYVTGSGSGGLAAVIGCSRLEEVVVDRPGRLYARFATSAYGNATGSRPSPGAAGRSRSGSPTPGCSPTRCPSPDCKSSPSRSAVVASHYAPRRRSQPSSSPPSTRRVRPPGERTRAGPAAVRPSRFAEAILAGTKSVEIRRRRPTVRPGAPVIIYATTPVTTVVGTARVVDVDAGDPAGIWSRYHTRVGLTRAEFDAYLAGAASAAALLLADAQRLPAPLTLADLRAVTPFQPPRSHRYLTQGALRQMVNGHVGARHLLARFDQRSPQLLGWRKLRGLLGTGGNASSTRCAHPPKRRPRSIIDDRHDQLRKSQALHFLAHGAHGDLSRPRHPWVLIEARRARDVIARRGCGAGRAVVWAEDSRSDLGRAGGARRGQAKGRRDRREADGSLR